MAGNNVHHFPYGERPDDAKITASEHMLFLGEEDPYGLMLASAIRCW